MTKVAIPIFGTRISPVFDSCLRVSVIEIKGNRETGRDDIILDGLSLEKRLMIFQEAGINTLICGGISGYFYNLFESAGIRVISGIAGDVVEVLCAFKEDKLEQPFFYMPGYCGRQIGKRGKSGRYRGKGGGRGAGPGGYCMCPECGRKLTHHRGKPCYSEGCPVCGTAMNREWV
ncbi:MAG: NifB/NifX family molybdenum-iron cluster-binding protein [Deltaproteobacteria bacterium]|nr:NifB/NifX family molybdenum-iron cluster-binding protein [Deltaproteobacteria bacterium]